MKILVVEDEQRLSQSMVEYLSAAGYLCEAVFNYPDAMDKIEVYDYDCIVLDLMLPGGSGIRLLEHLQQNRKTEGVIIISARDALEDRLAGLQAGADDYLIKPFHLSELSVRIAAIIRRRHQNGQSVISAGDICIDTVAMTASVGQELLELTHKEFQLLLFLVTNRNRVLSKSAIAAHLWSDEMDMAGSYDFLYTHIKNLRKKIITAGGEDCIRSVYGVGYKMFIP